MLSAIIALGLLFQLPLQESAEPLDAAMKRDQAAIGQLIAAFQLQDPVARTAALNRAGHLTDKRVIQASALALQETNEEVRGAAIEVLRFNASPLAQRVLLHELGKDRAPAHSKHTTARLIRGLCQKADPGSLPVLQALSIDHSERELREAWVLGLGRLRNRRSVASLMNFLGGLPASHRCLYMDDVRTSLMVLTGVDKGLDAEAWLRWWRDYGDSLRVMAFDPKLPEMVAIEWYGYWQLDPIEERKRQVLQVEKAGGDGEADSSTKLERPRSRKTPQASDWPKGKDN
jgi:hypothetical protein